MTRLPAGVLALTYLAALSSPANSFSQETTLSTGDRLGLTFSAAGALTGLSFDGSNALSSDVERSPSLSICDVTTGAGIRGGRGQDGCRERMRHFATNVDWTNCRSVRRSAHSDRRAHQGQLSVRDMSGEDRGLLVRFALPIRAKAGGGGTTWRRPHDRRQAGRTRTRRGIREFAALPEWRDKPALNMGSHSVNFCNVITGPVGALLRGAAGPAAHLPHRLRRRRGLFYIVYDVALAAGDQPAQHGRVHVLPLPLRPAVGHAKRVGPVLPPLSALLHEARPGRKGMWMAFSKLSEIDNANEFRFAFQEGRTGAGVRRPARRRQPDLLHPRRACSPTSRTTTRKPIRSLPIERQLAAMRAKFARQTGSAEIFDASGLHDVGGRLSIKRTAVYGHIIAQYNLDPELPYGKHMLDRVHGVFRNYREERGGELDGFYYDGITTGINYRREHFRHAELSARSGTRWPRSPSSTTTSRRSSSPRRRRIACTREGKITMMNGAMGSSFYTAPYLDVMGAETGLRINRTSFNYVRTICRQKPFVTLLKGELQPARRGRLRAVHEAVRGVRRVSRVLRLASQRSRPGLALLGPCRVVRAGPA